MNSKLILFYIKVLQEPNYKTLIDEIGFYELLGLTSLATKEEIQSSYEFLISKIRPENIPNNSYLKERFNYLVNKFHFAYDNLKNNQTLIDANDALTEKKQSSIKCIAIKNPQSICRTNKVTRKSDKKVIVSVRVKEKNYNRR